MSFENKHFLIIIWLLLPPILMTFSKENNQAIDTPTNIGSLSDDEISYALSELSFDDLNNLSKLIDVLSQETSISDENEFKSRQERSDEQSRYKRESSDTSAKQNENSLISNNVNQGYIRQLEESFPNIIDQPNQGEEKDKPLIRVKRD
ncbi:uncharacterized protein LOC129948870 [Eupeodes corollae]|uniref:uncharacterized protein LOC129948870 n=1 Tax=Eupeodes corollae TaxID=290404 RepID=UPI0024939ABD|nr:uncharacterized protein LOC129948870 [Eupeodes corollae]